MLHPRARRPLSPRTPTGRRRWITRARARARHVARVLVAGLGLLAVSGWPAHAAARAAERGERRAATAGSTEPTRTAAAPKGDAPELADGVTRDTLVRLALERSPVLASARARARAMRSESEAQARLPPPMAELQVWQVPFSEPHRLDRAGMTMIGLRQEFPPGRGARARAAHVEASVEDAMRAREAWMLVREVEHAFADYVEATELVQVHERHREAAERVAAYARARYAAGGSLQDIAQAEREIALVAADLAMARRAIDVARARINALLLRDPDAPLGPPRVAPPSSAHAEARELLARAERLRPELHMARRRREAASAMAEAERTRATTPSIGVGAYYFPPSETMRAHGFGVSVSATLPWLWGEGTARSRAAEARREAAFRDYDAARSRIALEVATSAAEVEVAKSALEALEQQVLPASARAEQAAFAGYEAGRADILAFLMARTALFETEVRVARARAALEHALTDLRWATGGPSFRDEHGPQESSDVR